MGHSKWAWALLVSAALLLGGCQKTASPGVANAQQGKRRPPAATPGETPEADAAATDLAKADAPGGFFYDSVGKRDPFRSFILDRVKELDSSAKGPLEQFDLSQLDVTGVVWEARRRRALVLDPSGQSYIVQEGDAIGKNDGEVLSIGDSVVLVREAYVDFHGAKTTKEIEMRVRQSQGG